MSLYAPLLICTWNLYAECDEKRVLLFIMLSVNNMCATTEHASDFALFFTPHD